LPIAKLNEFNCHYLQLEAAGENLELNHSQNHLIMVHGLATNLAFWYHLAHAFSHTHRVTLFDLRGHGKSSMPASNYTSVQLANDLKDLMHKLGIETATIVGHSFGGKVALNFLTEYPDHVNRLVLADTRLKIFQPLNLPSNWSNWLALKQDLKTVGIDLDDNEPEAGYKILTEIAKLQLRISQVKDSSQTQEYTNVNKLFPLRNSPRTASQWIKLIDTTTAWEDFTLSDSFTVEQLQRIKVPTLAIYGKNSPTLPTAYELQKLWPHLHLEIIPEAGHFFPVSHPQQFITSVRDFLAM
jgi:pimeloyl-ACP methyl ester carboxylesterase